LQRQRLIDNEEKAWEQNQALEEAKRKTRQIEGMSIEVMRDLEGQTGKMKNIGSKVENTNKHIEESNSIINRMWRRENRNKAVIAASASISVIAFIIILYFKL
jgi:hypothetical protein